MKGLSFLDPHTRDSLICRVEIPPYAEYLDLTDSLLMTSVHDSGRYAYP